MRKQAGLGPDDRLQPDHLSTNQDNWLRRFGIRMDTYGRADAEEEKVDLGKLNEALI